MRSLIGLILVLLIVFAVYKLYFSQLQSTGSAAPARAIEVTGVKNDLVAIAQAERMYQAEHGSYATLEQLGSGGAMTIAKSGRQGYTYAAEPSGNSFRVEARCSASDPGCLNYAIDETMEIRTIP